MAIVHRNALHAIADGLRSYENEYTNSRVYDYNIIIKTVIIIILLFSSLLINAKHCAMPWNHEIVNISANLSRICQHIYLYFYCIFLRFTTHFGRKLMRFCFYFCSVRSTIDDCIPAQMSNVQCSAAMFTMLNRLIRTVKKNVHINAAVSKGFLFNCFVIIIIIII